MLRQHTGLQQMTAATVIASVMAGTGKTIGQSGIKPRREAQNSYPRGDNSELADVTGP